MPLQSSGAISLADIASEFGGSTPHSMSEYYGASSGIPASGTISMNNFYGASALAQFTLTSNQQNFNARSWLLGQGWSGSGAVELTINSGVYIYASSTSATAFDMGGSFPSGLTLINNGRIMGFGGNAGGISGAFSSLSTLNQQPNGGGSGGRAMNLTGNIQIYNNGYIGGGGGGGAGAMAGGGAGGGTVPSFNSGTVANTTVNNSTSFTIPSAGTPNLGSNGGQPVKLSINSHYAQLAPNHYRAAHSPAGGNGGFHAVYEIII